MKQRQPISKSPLFSTLAMTLIMSLLLSSCGSSESNVESGNRTGTLHWGNGPNPRASTPILPLACQSTNYSLSDGRTWYQKTATP